MTVKTNSVTEGALGQMTSLALTGDVGSAQAVQYNSELNEEQEQKIAVILQGPLLVNTIVDSQTLKPRMIVVITKDGIVLNDTSATAPRISSASVTDLNEMVSSSPTTQIAPSHLSEIPLDIIGVLFEICISQSHWKTLSVFPLLNKRWDQFATNFWGRLDLRQTCPELTILDAKAQEVTCNDEPKVSKLAILKKVKELAPHVEENAGVTKLTMTKGTTLNQLIGIAKKVGVTVDIRNSIREQLGDVPVKQTYVILITNNVFVDSRNKAFNLQKTLVEGRGFKIPEFIEYTALCVFSKMIDLNCLCDNETTTYGRSSTLDKKDRRLVVGGYRPESVDLEYDSETDNQWHGVSGQIRF